MPRPTSAEVLSAMPAGGSWMTSRAVAERIVPNADSAYVDTVRDALGAMYAKRLVGRRVLPSRTSRALVEWCRL